MRKVDTIEVGGADVLVVLQHTIVKRSTSFKLPSWNLARADNPVRTILVLFDFIGLNAYFAGDESVWTGTSVGAN